MQCQLSSPIIHKAALKPLHILSRRSRGIHPATAKATGGSVEKPSVASYKEQLQRTISRLNSTEVASKDDLKQLAELVDQLSELNPTPDPATSPLINGRWALLYTVSQSSLPRPARSSPPASGSDSPLEAASPIQAASDLAYQFFYRYLPVIAGSATGVRGNSTPAVKSKGNFQVFDTAAGRVDNESRFSVAGRECLIRVVGTAEAVQPGAGQRATRLRAVFKDGELLIGDGIGRTRVPIPLGWISPVGYVDTLYLDEELRVSKGDKGSIFFAARVKA
mmetsp:Transcript_11134/g.24002  ORF Transcript_11134/g.24002 Transcript_11134/m.24002 type:complete len:278 (+) Transcript_11134:54-887(+)